MLYSGLRILESTVFHTGQEGSGNYVSKTIERNGQKYFPRQDITVVLVLGIDQFGPVADSGNYQNRGAADLDILLIFDETNRQINILHLNRDTMLEIPVLGIGGRQAGTYYGQLALAHTYGSGLSDSAENARKTISDFLYGLHIDYYVSMNMDAITILNDAVGGVTVNVTEDFSEVDPTIQKGQVHLTGEQAIHFVRSRKDVGDQLNLSRIERHKAYLDGFADAFRSRQAEDAGFILTAYEQVSPYLVTDLSANAVSGMMDRYYDYKINEIISPAGENVIGEEFMEFYVDEEALDALILRLFYAPKD
jgi:LCP family protein required for cell wall assembly